jgi:hypothetical protein
VPWTIVILNGLQIAEGETTISMSPLSAHCNVAVTFELLLTGSAAVHGVSAAVALTVVPLRFHVSASPLL